MCTSSGYTVKVESVKLKATKVYFRYLCTGNAVDKLVYTTMHHDWNNIYVGGKETLLLMLIQIDLHMQKRRNIVFSTGALEYI